MRNIIFIFILSFYVQGCTFLGMALDSKLPPPRNGDKQNEGFTQAGLAQDVAVVKSVISGEHLPERKTKKSTGCQELKGVEKEECYKISNQLSKSFKKHSN
jgi:hypothetical protein